MKKRILVLALTAIVLGCAIGGTAAYYTDQRTAANVITAGNIKAELQVWADADMTAEYVDPDEAVVPGENVARVVTVKNTGDHDAWIRLRFVTTAEGDNVPADGDLPMILNVDTDRWILREGWYYYHAILGPGLTADPVFTTVSFEPSMGNVWQNAAFRIAIDMQAVQAANNGSSVLDAAGWPAA